MTFSGIPRKVRIALTYRCNFDCIHCRASLIPGDACHSRELTFSEIRSIVDSFQALGSRSWSVTGGEPMLRSDFPEIFDYITSRAVSCSLYTNGMLVDPHIAALMARHGSNVVPLYGASRETYETLTRNPDAFEQVLQGLRYIKEAGARCIVELNPLQANRHEWGSMVELAEKLGSCWRVCSPWLNSNMNCNDRLSSLFRERRSDLHSDIVSDDSGLYKTDAAGMPCDQAAADAESNVLAIAGGGYYHIDPYGGLSAYPLRNEATVRYNLRGGSVEMGLQTIRDSAASRVCAVIEFSARSGAGYDREDSDLDAMSDERRWREEVWAQHHRRYFSIGGIIIQVNSDLPINEKTFESKFDSFVVPGPGEDTVSINHHFGIPDIEGLDFGKELYRTSPWAISQKSASYIYRGIAVNPEDPSLHQVSVCGEAHNCLSIYNSTIFENAWLEGQLHSLTMFPTDQIFLARLLADRSGFFLHSAGLIINGAGVLFVGHSEAGKSTTTNLLTDAGMSGRLEVEVLCDDRNIIRRMADGWRVYGSWSHGDVSVVSSANAPLRAICFIEKSDFNRIELMSDRNEVTRRLLACLIRPLMTSDWLEKTLDHVTMMMRQVPCYRMQFDKSGKIVDEIIRITADRTEIIS